MLLALVACAAAYKQWVIRSAGGLAETVSGEFRLRSDLPESQQREALREMNAVRERCRAVFGSKRPVYTQKITVYYLRDVETMKKHYRRVTGESLKSFDGICLVDPAIIFGCAHSGPGNISHELVHIYVANDWKKGLPGWLDESLAVGIGCPMFRLEIGKRAIKDLYLFAVLRGLQEGKWTPLAELVRHPGPDYEGLDHTKVMLPGAMSTVVGPLSTGRALVRWMDAGGVLPGFYRAFRDTGSFESALGTVAASREEAERQLLDWLNVYDKRQVVE